MVGIGTCGNHSKMPRSIFRRRALVYADAHVCIEGTELVLFSGCAFGSSDIQGRRYSHTRRGASLQCH